MTRTTLIICMALLSACTTEDCDIEAQKHLGEAFAYMLTGFDDEKMSETQRTQRLADVFVAYGVSQRLESGQHLTCADARELKAISERMSRLPRIEPKP